MSNDQPQPGQAATDKGPSPGVTILHRGPHYVVRFLRCTAAPWAVVSFEYWKPAPTLDGEFAGEGFFRDRGLNAIGIMAATNDWFQDDEILDVLAAIRAATPGFRLIGYGASMGGFAVINFAADLGLASLVAVVPQISLDPAKSPYETRWRAEAARTAFRHDKIGRIPRQSNGWILFDPWCVDGQHVTDIQRHHALGEVRVHFGGHAQMLMLQQAGLYTPLLLSMLEERFDPAAFRRDWRTRRRLSAAYWLGLSQALLARGRAAAALRAILTARTLPHPEPAWIDLTHGEALLALGQASAARDLAAAWAQDPAFGDLAQDLLRRCPISAPVPPHATRLARALGRLKRLLPR